MAFVSNARLLPKSQLFPTSMICNGPSIYKNHYSLNISRYFARSLQNRLCTLSIEHKKWPAYEEDVEAPATVAAALSMCCIMHISWDGLWMSFDKVCLVNPAILCNETMQCPEPVFSMYAISTRDSMNIFGNAGDMHWWRPEGNVGLDQWLQHFMMACPIHQYPYLPKKRV